MTRPDRARVELRRTQAIELRAAGHDYDSIAAQLGFSNRSGAWKAVENGLRANQAAATEDLRALEVARLDRLQEGLWPKATSGDVRAALAVVRIIETRAKLMGLALDPRTAAPQPQTIIMDPSQLVSYMVSQTELA